MEDIDLAITLLIAAILAICVTFAALVALWRGDRPGQTLKTWFRRMVDIVVGL